MAKPGSSLDRRTKAGCRVWFGSQQAVLVQLAATAPAHSGPMVVGGVVKRR